MVGRQPITTRTDTLLPDTTLVRSDRIATALREDDQPDDTTGTDGVTTTTAHIGENTVTWINDSEGHPIRAEADLSEVFSVLDRSSAETRAQRRSKEHTSALQSLLLLSYAVFCLKQNKTDAIQ